MPSLEMLEVVRPWGFSALMGALAVWLVGAEWARQRRARRAVWHGPRPRQWQVRTRALRRAARAIARSDRGRAAQALGRAPRNADAVFLRGLLAEAAGAPREAEAHYRAALALDAAHGASAYNLGGLLWEAGRAAEAIVAYQRAIASGTAADAHYNLALVYFQLHMDALAHHHCAEAAKLEPRAIDAHDNLQLLSVASRAAEIKRPALLPAGTAAPDPVP